MAQDNISGDLYRLAAAGLYRLGARASGRRAKEIEVT
jgi:hypothetical protein